MSEYIVTPEGLAAALAADAVATSRHLDNAIIEAAAAGAEVIASDAPVDLGILKSSIHADGREIIADAPHAGIIEFGSRPHTPPIGPLIRWAERHGAENPEAMARSIQNKIAREGTRPRLFVGKHMPKLQAILGNVIDRVLK